MTLGEEVNERGNRRDIAKRYCLREVAPAIRTAAKPQTILGVQMVFGYEFTVDSSNSLVK